MTRYLLFLTTLCLYSCASQQPYTWQDTRQPAREEATLDLEECKAYAARQYKPGIPAGEPYLSGDHAADDFMDATTRGVWRPDRNPTSTVNSNSLSIHDIPTEYTGYPGELDYSPDYLDDILEKCMSDRGWEYGPETANDDQ